MKTKHLAVIWGSLSLLALTWTPPLPAQDKQAPEGDKQPPAETSREQTWEQLKERARSDIERLEAHKQKVVAELKNQVEQLKQQSQKQIEQIQQQTQRQVENIEVQARRALEQLSDQQQRLKTQASEQLERFQARLKLLPDSDRGNEPPVQRPTSTDQKLDRILDRLDRLERRLDRLERRLPSGGPSRRERPVPERPAGPREVQ
jgi:hypothetical protein